MQNRCARRIAALAESPRLRRLRSAAFLCIFCLSSASFLLFTACPGRSTTRAPAERLDLWFVNSLPLSSPASMMCPDPNGLLLPANSGADILSTDFELRAGPGIALPQRVAGIKGIAADAFAIYLFDDSRLHRLDRSQGLLSPLSSNVRFQGGVMRPSGELVFSDGYSDRILTFDPSGNVSDVNVHRPQFKPGALALGPDRSLFVINQGMQEMAVFDGIGNLVRACPLPAAMSRIAVDDSLNAYLLERSGNQVWQVNRRNQVRKVSAGELGLRFVAFDIAVHHHWLYLLDRGQCILRFRLAAD